MRNLAPQHRRLTLTAALVIPLAVAAVTAAGAVEAPVNLLRNLASGTLQPSQTKYLDLYARHPSTLEIRPVAIPALAALEGCAPLDSTFFPGLTVRIECQRVERRGPGDFSYFGTLGHGTTDAFLTVRDGELSGSVRTVTEHFEIRSLGGGAHAVLRVDDSAFPPDDEETFEIARDLRGLLRATSAPLGRASESPLLSAPQAATTSTLIKLLVPYTQGALDNFSSANALHTAVQNRVDETNTAYANSGISVTLELVNTVAVTYSESNSLATDLDRLIVTNDGFMDDVHGKRNLAFADIVMLLSDTRDPDFCGLATVFATSATAFGVVRWDCLSQRTLPHEIGHLYGARHDDLSEDWPYSYGHGFIYAPGGWRTLMARNDQPGVRVLHYSNPDVSIGGQPTGTAADHDVARVHDVRDYTLSRFIPSPIIYGPNPLVVGDTGTWFPGGTVYLGSAYTYKWFTSTNGTSWTYTGVTTKSFSKTATTTASFWVKVEIRSSLGGFEIAQLMIYVKSSPGDPE